MTSSFFQKLRLSQQLLEKLRLSQQLPSRRFCAAIHWEVLRRSQAAEATMRMPSCLLVVVLCAVVPVTTGHGTSEDVVRRALCCRASSNTECALPCVWSLTRGAACRRR